MKKLFSKTIAVLLALTMILSLVGTSAFAADFTKFKVDNGEVTLDGTNPGTVTVAWVGTGDQNVFALEGSWSTKETDGTNYLTLTEITSEVLTFSGFNYTLVSTGKVYWLDSTLSAPGKVSDGKALLKATYQVAADTPAGTYTVTYSSVNFTGDDYNPDTSTEVVTAKITVKGNNPVVPVESVSLDKTELKLAKGGNAKLTATVNPADATDKTVTWTTSNDKVATVAADGTVTAVGEGTAVITATAGGKTADCTVTVVNCLHTSKSYVAEKAATCTEKGMKAHYKCDNCSALFETETSTTPVEASTLETAMIAHIFTDVPEKAATCTEKGNVAYKHCSTCGKNYDAEGNLLETVETDALSHDMTFMSAVPATCKDTGTKAYYHCGRCNKNFVDPNGQRELTDLTTDKDPNNHAGGTELVNVKASSHVKQEDGYTGDTKCLGCGKIIAKGQVIPWGTHVWSDWKHDADKHWKECTVEGCTAKTSEAAHQPLAGTPNCVSSATCQVCGYEVAESNPNIHTKIVKVAAKAPTCTEDGNKEYYQCTGCGNKFSDAEGTEVIVNVVIDAHHTLTAVAEKAPTCRLPGTAAYDKCTACGKLFDKDGKEITAPVTLPLADHTWDTVWHSNKDGHYHECTVCGIAGTVTAHTPGAAATETTPQTCTECGYIIAPATGHGNNHTKDDSKWVSDATSHWHACTGCSEQLDKANHTVASDKWTIDKEATTTEEGLRHGKCTVCGHVVYETIAKTTTGGGGTSGGGTSKPSTKDDGKKVESGKTFDAGVGLYVGLSILSMTGSAVVIGKKRKTR